MVQELILQEIDETLERLIQNAEILTNVDHTQLSEFEIEAFQKTQESLLQHWIYMDQVLESKSKRSIPQNKNLVMYKIQEKTKRFKKLKAEVNNTIRKTKKTFSFFSKRRGKKLLKV